MPRPYCAKRFCASFFQQGFFKVRDLNLEIARESLELHVPYWLGFYGHVAARWPRPQCGAPPHEGLKASACSNPGWRLS